MSTDLHPTSLQLHPLSFLEEDGEVVVGRSDIDSFGVFPPDGAALVRELAAGRTPDAAAAWYADTYQERVDMAQFIATLRELGFVRVDGEPTAAPAAVRWQRLGRALFSAPAWAAYFALLIAAVLTCLADARMLPRATNVVFSDSLMLVALCVFVGQLSLAAVHEAFHVLAGRRLGVRSSVRVSRRFYFIVFETNLDGLAVLPRRQRWLPILAGLLCDLLAFCVLTLIAYLTRTPDGEVSAVGGVCLALAFTTLPRMAWQFYFFLRTDIYYLITTLTGCVDLDSAARAMLANTASRLLGRPPRRDLSRFHRRDRRAARWFAPLIVAGYAAMLAMLVVTLPVLWQLLSTGAERVLFGDAASALDVWDAALFLALVVAQFTFALSLALRRRRTGKTAP